MANSCVNINIINQFMSEVLTGVGTSDVDIKKEFISRWKKFFKKYNLLNKPDELNRIFNAMRFQVSINSKTLGDLNEYLGNLTQFRQLALMESKGNKDNDDSKGNKESELNKEPKETDRSFIWTNYGTSTVKNLMQQQFTEDMVSSMYVNSEEFVLNEKELNENIRNRQQLLWEKIIEYAEASRSPLYKALVGSKLFDASGNYTGIIEDYRNDLNRLISKDMSYIRLDSLYQGYRKGNKRDKLTLDAYNSWFLLRNFDRMLKLVFKDGIRIREGMSNSFLNYKPNKYTFGNTSNLISTWRDDSKDYDTTQEVGDIPRNIIITRQLYDKNGTKKEGERLQFSHVTSVIPKLWDLYYNPTFRDTKLTDAGIDTQDLEDKYSELYGISIDPDITYGQLIAKAGLDAAIWYPILFDVLTRNESQSELYTQGFTDDELGVIQTLNITIFNPFIKESLAYIHNQYYPSDLSISYFSYMNQMLDSLNRVVLREYYQTDDNEIRIRNLFDKSIDEARYALENEITAFMMSNLSDVHVTDIKDQNNFSVHYDNGLSVVKFEDNKIYLGILGLDNDVEFEELNINDYSEVFDKLRDLISNVTTIDFSQGSPYSDTLEALENRSGGYYLNIIQLVKNIIYNFSSAKTCEGLNKKGINEKLNTLYTTNKPKINSDLSINLINQDDVPKLRTLSEIVQITDGRNFDSVVRDGEGAQISTANLSMLATNLKQQYELMEKCPESATRHFSIFKMFNGVDFVRDFKGKSLNKKATSFNHTEVLTSCLLDYFSGVEDRGGVGQINSMGFLASIISDKFRLIRSTIDPNTFVLIDGKNKRVKELTFNEIKTLVRQELIPFYENVRDDINNRLLQLGRILQPFGYNSTSSVFDFNLLNQIIKNNGINTKEETEEFLHNLLFYKDVNGIKRQHHLQKLNLETGKYEDTEEYLELRDIIDFTINKDGSISRNEFLYSQKFDDDFFDVKNTEMINDILYDNITVATSDNRGIQIGGNAYVNLRKKNENWIQKSTGNLAVCSLTMWKQDGTSYTKLISNKQDLYNIDSRHSYKNILENPDSTLSYRSSTEAINLAKKFGIQIINGIVDSSALDVENPNFNIQLAVGALSDYLAYNVDITNAKKLFYNSDNKVNNDEVLEYLNSKGINTEGLTNPQKLRLAAIEKIKEGQGLSDSNVYRANKITVNYNPSLITFNALDFFVSQEFMITSVGTHLGHPGSTEAKKWMQQVKRNVSLSAAKHKAQLNQLNGLYQYGTVCVIKDDRDDVFNISGNKDMAKPWDGSMFVNGVTSYLENNSLDDAHGGVTKKEFAHGKHIGTGTGIIIKTAGYPMTNAALRNSGIDYIQGEFMQEDPYNQGSKYILHRKMMSRDIGEFMNNPIEGGMDITKGFLNQDLWSNTDDFYLYDPGTERYYRFNMRADVIFNNGETTITYHPVNESGEDLVLAPITMKYVFRNAYSIWRAFGGEFSCSLLTNTKNGNRKLQFSEGSFENTTKIVNNIGEINPGYENSEIVSQTQVNQYLKKSLIDFAVTEGAIKQGAANINSTKALFDPNYDLSVFRMLLHDFGIQLDAEHIADDSVLAMMTQVVNALGARGYTSVQANRVYNALYNIAIENLGNLEDGLTVSNSEQFREEVIKLIVDSLTHPTANDGNILHLIASKLQPIINSNNVTLESTKDVILLDHPSVFSKLISNISSSLTKKCVRLKFPGLMCVLNPSNKLTKIYNGHLRSYYKGNLRKELEKLPDTQGVVNIHKVTLGAEYLVYDQSGLPVLNHDGSPVIVKINNPVTYKAVKEQYPNHLFKEYYISGRDLAASNAYFKVGKQDYCIWDLDVVQELYEAESAPIRNELVIKTLRRELQQALNVLGDGKGVLRINDKWVTPTNINIQAFEAILPMIFKTQFGLEDGDDVQDIVNDRYFFLRRAVENGDFDCAISNSDHFDLEINAGNKQSLYLLTDFRDSIPSGLTKDNDVEKRKDLQGNWWLLDENGENRMQISSEDDVVYLDPDGNEIIYTKNPTFFINNVNGVLTISESVTNTDKPIEEFFAKLENKQVSENGKVTVNPKTKNLLASLRSNVKQTEEETDKAIKEDIRNGWRNRNIFIEELKKDLETSLFDKNFNLYVSPKNFQDYRRNRLIEYYLNKHSSFQKSLKTLVARIPAQSHQSFMAMKVVGFSDNVNNAMVSIAQLWLQGSDFDIDKASFLGYKFKNGVFVNWSPYMKLATALDTKYMLEASEKLPFPSGKIEEVQTEKSFPQEIIELANTLINNYGEIKVPKTVEEMNSLVTLFNFCEENGVMQGCDALVKAWNNHNMYFKNNKGLKVTDALVNFISTNMYNISNNPKNWIQGQTPIDQASDRIKALAVLQPMEIKTHKYSPGNIMSKIEMLRLTITGKENTGIMASGMKVFEALSQYYYNILNSGTLDEQQKLAFMDKITNNVKFVANAYASKLLYSEFEENSIAWNTAKKLQGYLDNVDNAEDAFIVLSAMLSLSTDNAKDPTLSKINANPEMIGLYTAGIMSGMTIDELVKIILSPTGQILNELQKGDVFSGKQGQFGIQGAVNYINNGPEQLIELFWYMFDVKNNELLSEKLQKNSYQDFKEQLTKGTFYEVARKIMKLRDLAKSNSTEEIKLDIDGFKKYLDNEQERIIENIDKLIKYNSVLQSLHSSDIKGILSELQQMGNQEDLIKLLKRNNYKTDPKKELEKYITNSKNKVVKIQEASNYITRTVSANKKIDWADVRISDLAKDYKADTFQQSDIGYIQDVKSSTFKFLGNFINAMKQWNNYRNSVENDIDEDGIQIFDKLKYLAEINSELSLLQPLTKLNQGLPNSPAEQISYMDKIENIISSRAKYAHITNNSKLSAFKQVNKSTIGEETLRIDINSFLHNPTYQKAVLETYDSIKCMINPLRVILSVKHYNGYLTAMNALYNSFIESSGKYNFLHNCAVSILPSVRIRGAQKQDYLRKSSSFYDFVINSEFLGAWSDTHPIKITKGYYYDKYNKLTPVNGEVYVDLKTEQGRATFKYWMEHIVFPKLKQELRGINKFIEDIRPTKQKFISSTKNSIICYTLPINMMPKRGSYEEFQLMQYKHDLMALNYIDSDPYTHKPRFGNLFELVYLYNTIVYNNQSNKTSFTKLTEELDYDSYPIIRMYNQVLSSHTMGNPIKYSINDYITWISPVIYPEQRKADMGYVLNWDTGKYVFVQKIKMNMYDDEDMDLMSELGMDFESEIFGEDFDAEGRTFESQLALYGYEIVNKFDRGSDFVTSFTSADYEKTIVSNEDGTIKFNKLSKTFTWEHNGQTFEQSISQINKKLGRTDWLIQRQKIKGRVSVLNVDLDETLENLRKEFDLEKGCK